MKLIKRRQTHSETTHERVFRFKDNDGCSYGFPCDEEGNLEPLKSPALENWERCTAPDQDEFIDCGIQSFDHRWTEPAVGRCSCGRELELTGFTNWCDCGKNYNISGHLLAPVEQWGEETGEHWSDIARL